MVLTICLGGGIAKIVGVRKGITAIAFASPGIVWSRKKFNLEYDKIQQLVVNIRPSDDIVSKIDKNGGLVQHVDCDGSPVRCHSLTRTVQQLIRRCGSDPLGRWIWA